MDTTSVSSVSNIRRIKVIKYNTWDHVVVIILRTNIWLSVSFIVFDYGLAESCKPGKLYNFNIRK